jgi:hypothetical protein
MLRLPVSIGEAIDKLTILEIKLSKIQNEDKLNQVKKEYDYLHTDLDLFLQKCQPHYKQLLKINKSLWQLEDVIRTELTMEECAVVSKKIVYENDSRFRTKDKINKLLGSEIREQKAYIFINCKEINYKELVEKHNDTDRIIEEILYYSVRNNSVKIFTEELTEELKRAKEFFQYDECVSFEFKKKVE